MSPENARSRNRMIFDLPPDMQLAIRLCALKSNMTTAQVVCKAMESAFASGIAEAKTILAEQNQEPKLTGRKRKIA